jgi:predicted MFS family arabinose efflux permease
MTAVAGTARSRFPGNSPLAGGEADQYRGKRDRPGRSARAGWRRDFRLLWLGETTSSLGSSVTIVALPLVAISLHASVVMIGLLSAAAWLPWLLIGLPAGAWVDRLPKRPVMLVCDAVSLAMFVSVPIAAGLGMLTISQLLVVALLAGTAKVFFATAYRTYLPALVPAQQLVDGNAKLQGSESAAQVAGPGLAGMLAQAVGAATGLLADAVSFLVSAVCLRAIRDIEPQRTRTRQRLRHEIGEGLRFVARDRFLRPYVLFGGVANLALTGYQAIVVVFLVREVGVGSGTVGLLIATGSVGGVLGATVAPWLARRLGTARALLLAKVGVAPFGLLIPLTGSGARLAFFVVGGCVVVAGIVAGNVISAGFTQRYCPAELFGRISTSMQVVNFGTIPVGAMLGGVLGSALGTRVTLWLMLGLFVASGAIIVASPFRGRRDLPTEPSHPGGTIGA